MYVLNSSLIKFASNKVGYTLSAGEHKDVEIAIPSSVTGTVIFIIPIFYDYPAWINCNIKYNYNSQTWLCGLYNSFSGSLNIQILYRFMYTN